MHALSKYTVISDELPPVLGRQPHVIVFSTLSLRAFEVRSDVLRNLKLGNFSAIRDDLIAELRRAQIITSATQREELLSVLRRNRHAIADAKVLFESIQPTAACQLACDYCGQAHTRQMLSENDQDAILDRLHRKLSTRRFELLEIGWFGAEPLLGLKVILSMSGRLKKLASTHGVEYGAKMITNGYALRRSTARRLQSSCNLRRVEITLDGSTDTHDARRFTKAGKGTFATIFANLVALADDTSLTFDIVLRANVDRRNAPSIPWLIETLAEKGLQKRVGLYFAPLHDWGNTASESNLGPEVFAALEVEWLAQMMSLGFSVPLMPSAKPIVCIAVNPDSALTDPYGHVFNCTEVPLVPQYGVINIYSQGRGQEHRASLPARRLENFLEDIESGKFGCSECEMLPVCGGACPKQWNDGIIPCPSAKKNLKERLLLHWASTVTQRPAVDSGRTAEAILEAAP